MAQFLPRTKIVATLGPASEREETVRQMAEAGVSIFRLNSAHGEPAWHDRLVRVVRQVAREIGRPLAILQDLSGPKWRLGDLPGGSILLHSGQRLRLLRQADSAPDTLTCNYPQLLASLSPGMTLLLADGTVALRVVQRLADGVELEVVVPGEIRSRQGIAAPGLLLDLPALTKKDFHDLAAAARREVDYIGLSFVRRPDDICQLRQELDRLHLDAGVIAKIECAAALDHLDEIIRLSDAVMVARGDLGVETDLARVPLLQKEIIARCFTLGKPVITATQMLESMRESNRPTRAEVSDVANAILDGTDAVMLSAETASGRYPIEAVLTIRRIAEATEAALSQTARVPYCPPNTRVNILRAIAQAAGQLADQIRAKLVVVATHAGHSAQALSKQRFLTPVLGISHQEKTIRRMCLYWGVMPVFWPYLARPEIAPQQMAETSNFSQSDPVKAHEHAGSEGQPVPIYDDTGSSQEKPPAVHIPSGALHPAPPGIAGVVTLPERPATAGSEPSHGSSHSPSQSETIPRETPSWTRAASSAIHGTPQSGNIPHDVPEVHGQKSETRSVTQHLLSHREDTAGDETESRRSASTSSLPHSEDAPGAEKSLYPQPQTTVRNSEPPTLLRGFPLLLAHTVGYLQHQGWIVPGDRIVFVLGAHWSGTNCPSLFLYEA